MMWALSGYSGGVKEGDEIEEYDVVNNNDI